MRICNIIASLDTKSCLNLNSIKEEFRENVKYRPEKFPGLSLRITHPKSTVLIFRSGKLVSTGTKSGKDAKRALNKVVQMLKLTMKSKHVKINNYVGTGDVKHIVDMYKLYERCKRKCVYEVEIFPALKYVYKKVTVNIFSTGKYVLTGSNKKRDLQEADTMVRSLLK